MKYSLQKWKADVERYAIQKQDGEGKEINNQELIGDLTPLHTLTGVNL